jgi:hypothetical protein
LLPDSPATTSSAASTSLKQASSTTTNPHPETFVSQLVAQARSRNIVFSIASNASDELAHMQIFCGSLREASPLTEIVVFVPSVPSSVQLKLAVRTRSFLVEYDQAELLPIALRTMHTSSLRWSLLHFLV